MDKLIDRLNKALSDSKANPHRDDLKILVMNLSYSLLREGYVGHHNENLQVITMRI